jgi:hypothetical protein
MSKRIGRTVIEGDEQFEVVWPRAEEVFVPRVTYQPLTFNDRPIPTYAEGREILMKLLEQQTTWRTKELLAEAMMPQAMFWALLQHFRRHRLTIAPDRGWVSLRRVSVAA